MKIFSRKLAHQNKTLYFSLGVIIMFGLVAVLAPWLAPRDPYQRGLKDFNLPPMWVRNVSPPGTAEFPLGTDRFGRDILSRQLYGTRTALFLALTAVPLSALIGTLLGLTAGYIGGRLDASVRFLADMLQSLPGIMFLVIIILIFRSLFTPTWFHGLATLVIGFVAVSWVGLYRLIRIHVMSIRSQLFVDAAISIGASPWRIITRHVLPNVRHLVLVWIINNVPAVILLEAMLGYIGVGVTSAVDGGEFTVVSWGGIFFSGRSALNHNPLMLIVPSLGILLISLSFFLLGDFLSASTTRE